jgi:raffinose/stachyose/melibiose transport system permease protein
MVIFLANLQSISTDMYEAAAIDGASGWKRFLYVTLPMMCPSVKIVAVTGLIGGMKVYDIIYSMTSGGPGDATQTVMTVMMKKGISDGFYNTGSAFGVCFFVVVVFISSIVTKFMGKWSEAIQ